MQHGGGGRERGEKGGKRRPIRGREVKQGVEKRARKLVQKLGDGAWQASGAGQARDQGGGTQNNEQAMVQKLMVLDKTSKGVGVTGTEEVWGSGKAWQGEIPSGGAGLAVLSKIPYVTHQQDTLHSLIHEDGPKHWDLELEGLELLQDAGRVGLQRDSKKGRLDREQSATVQVMGEAAREEAGGSSCRGRRERIKGHRGRKRHEVCRVRGMGVSCGRGAKEASQGQG